VRLATVMFIPLSMSDIFWSLRGFFASSSATIFPMRSYTRVDDTAPLSDWTLLEKK
jgi:hypothetical protein